MGSTYNSEVSMQPIFLPDEDMIGVCACCNTKENTTLCRYACQYRPKAKYFESSREGHIHLYLCPLHKELIDNQEDLRILGWDWWDMLDSLPQ